MCQSNRVNPSPRSCLPLSRPLDASTSPLGSADADIHRFDFIPPLILVGPPDACSGPLAGRRDPVPAGRVLLEGEPAESAGLDGCARIVEVDRVLAARLQRLGEIDPDRVQLALVAKRRVAEQNPVDRQVCVEVELNPRVVLQHLEANRVLAADDLLHRIDADVQVVESRSLFARCRPYSPRRTLARVGAGVSWDAAPRPIGSGRASSTAASSPVLGTCDTLGNAVLLGRCRSAAAVVTKLR